MRELRATGVVKLVLVPTDDMVADLLTKPLPDSTFEKHRDTAMNARARSGSQASRGGIAANGVTDGSSCV